MSALGIYYMLDTVLGPGIVNIKTTISPCLLELTVRGRNSHGNKEMQCHEKTAPRGRANSPWSSGREVSGQPGWAACVGDNFWVPVRDEKEICSLPLNRERMAQDGKFKPYQSLRSKEERFLPGEYPSNLGVMVGD